MFKQVTVLLTSYGCPGGPSIFDALRRNYGVVTADCNPEVAELDFVLPPAEDIGYIKALNEVCDTQCIDVVVPCSSAEAHRLACDKDKVHAKVITNHPKILENCMDKSVAYRLLKEYAPKYVVVKNLEQFKKACYSLGYPDFPVFTKPCIGNGSRGAIYIRGSLQYEKAISRKKINTMTLNGFIENFKYTSLPELLVMEYLPHTEWSIDVLCREGEVLVAIPRVRLATKDGICIDSQVEKNIELIEAAKNIVAKMNLSYAVNIQFREDTYFNYKLLEINPRVAGSMCVSVGAGVNMFDYIVRMRLGYELPTVYDVNWGTRMRRVFKEIYTYE